MSHCVRLIPFSFLILIAGFATLDGMKFKSVTPVHHVMIMVNAATAAGPGVVGLALIIPRT
jgi:hypothetical protein